MEHVVVERLFEEPVTKAQMVAMRKRGKWCLDAHRVRYLQGFLSADGRRMVCHFEAPDTESVRLVNRQIGAPFERVWTAQVLAPVEETVSDEV